MISHTSRVTEGLQLPWAVTESRYGRQQFPQTLTCSASQSFWTHSIFFSHYHTTETLNGCFTHSHVVKRHAPLYCQCLSSLSLYLYTYPGFDPFLMFLVFRFRSLCLLLFAVHMTPAKPLTLFLIVLDFLPLSIFPLSLCVHYTWLPKKENQLPNLSKILRSHRKSGILFGEINRRFLDFF